MNDGRPIGILVVDDEILAIEHLVSLVDWDRSDFAVVAKATRPERALQLVAEARPRIVIADIRMPGMDGLEFCRRALSIDPSLRFLLLSAHRDFDCAKRAIALGASDYLVKHELDGPSLLAKLESVARDQEAALRTSSLARRSLIQDLASGGPQPEAGWADPLLGLSGRSVSAALFELDAPYPVVPVAGTVSSLDVELLARPERAAHETAETLPLDSGRVLALLVSPFSSRPAELDVRLRTTFSAVSEASRKRGGPTVSASFVRSLPTPADLAPALRALERKLDERVFHGSSVCLDAEAPEIGAQKASSAFGSDPVSFRAACDRAVAALDERRSAAGLPPVTELVAAEGTPSAWNSAEGIVAWFAEMDAEAERSRLLRSGYSRPVREVVARIDAYPGEDLSADALASRVSLGVDRLRRRFREETGRTLLDYVTDRRVDAAKALLRRGGFKVYEVAERCGFHDARYFSRVFRERTGMNPFEYADRAGRGEDGRSLQG